MTFGGESQDSEAEVMSQIRTSDCTVDTTAAGIATGTQCVKFPTNTAAHKAILPMFGELTILPQSRILMMSGSIEVPAGLTSEVGLISEAVQDGDKFVTIGTDYKIRFYDSGGTQVGVTSTQALTGGTK